MLPGKGQLDPRRWSAVDRDGQIPGIGAHGPRGGEGNVVVDVVDFEVFRCSSSSSSSIITATRHHGGRDSDACITCWTDIADFGPDRLAESRIASLGFGRSQRCKSMYRDSMSLTGR